MQRNKVAISCGTRNGEDFGTSGSGNGGVGAVGIAPSRRRKPPQTS